MNNLRCCGLKDCCLLTLSPVHQAAPELLAALEAILTYEDDQPEPDTFGATVYAQAQAAIRKAKGE